MGNQKECSEITDSGLIAHSSGVFQLELSQDEREITFLVLRDGHWSGEAIDSGARCIGFRIAPNGEGGRLVCKKRSWNIMSVQFIPDVGNEEDPVFAYRETN